MRGVSRVKRRLTHRREHWRETTENDCTTHRGQTLTALTWGNFQSVCNAREFGILPFMSERSGSLFRRGAAVVAALTITIALSACKPSPVQSSARSASASPTVTERQIVDAVNRYRAAHKLGALTINSNLSDKAKLWSAYMAGGNCGRAANGTPAICHSNVTSGITVSWSWLGENVGAAAPKTNITGLLAGFERSPSHAANMASTRATSIGVGVAYNGNTIYVAEEFMAR
jgi:uncharacterized protein YkwD